MIIYDNGSYFILMPSIINLARSCIMCDEYCIVLYLNDMIIKSSSSLILNWMWALAHSWPGVAHSWPNSPCPCVHPLRTLTYSWFLHFSFSNSIRIVQCASMLPRLDFWIIFQIQYFCQFQFDPSIQFVSISFSIHTIDTNKMILFISHAIMTYSMTRL